MKFPSLPVWLLSLASLASATSASAQLELVIRADPALTWNYDPAEDIFDPALTISTTATPPATLNYTGVESGTFTMRFVAPEGLKFVLDPRGETLRLFFQVDYVALGEIGGLSALTGRSLGFVGAEGTTPSVFTDYSAISDSAGSAYLSVNFTMPVTEAFSFTELVYTRAFTGTGAGVSLEPGTDDYFLNVQNEHYFGAEPPLHTPYLDLVAIPEPSAAALFGGLGAAALALTRRRRR